MSTTLDVTVEATPSWRAQFEKGGYCKKLRDHCYASDCPPNPLRGFITIFNHFRDRPALTRVDGANDFFHKGNIDACFVSGVLGMTESEVFDDLKIIARQTVSIFRTVRDEVESQFSELSPEERHKVFLLIAPFVADLFTIGASGALIEDEPELGRKSKRKR